MESNKLNSRKIQAEERRCQILDTALMIFAAKGFANTSIKDLANSAGISAGLMYHYFPSKEKLFEEAIEQSSFLPQLKEILNNTGVSPCREVLKDISLKFIDLLDRRDTLIKIFLQEGASNAKVKGIWSNLVREGGKLMQDYIAASISAGELRPHNTEVTARCLFSGIFMFKFTRDMFKANNISKVKFIDEMLDNLLHGIQGKAG
jgi:AcrR family transcriptional regulator